MPLLKENINYVVYLHRNPITGMVFYVGIGNTQRPYTTSKRSDRWKNYVNKYGKPVIEIYKSNLLPHEAFNLERYLIQLLGRRGYESYGQLFNHSEGGECGGKGVKVKLETKKKISRAFAGENGINTGRKHSEETKANMSLSHKGKKWSEKMRENFKKAVANGSFKGRKSPSLETKEKIRQSLLGRKVSPESMSKRRIAIQNKNRNKPIKPPRPIRIFRDKSMCIPCPYKVIFKYNNTGYYFPAIYIWKRKPASEETKIKIGLGNKGKTVSSDARLKMSKSHKVIQLFAKKVIDNNTGILYDSITKAAEANNISAKRASSWLRGTVPSRKNYFRYYEAS